MTQSTSDSPRALPLEIASEFVRKINNHDVHALCGMMTEDHLFIDSLGTRMQGRENMLKAWQAYFVMVPDYIIEITHQFSEGSEVALLGIARGTFSPDGALRMENRWSMPAAWRALVRDRAVAEWQVYADNEPVRKLVSEHSE